MSLEQIIFVGKWIESDGTSEGIQKKLDKYGLIHQLSLSEKERTIQLTGSETNVPKYLSSPEEFDGEFELSDEGEFLPVYDVPSSSKQIVSEYVVRRKEDSLGNKRFDLFFPFGEGEKEDRTKAIVGLRVQYRSLNGDNFKSNEFSVNTLDIWG